MASVLAGLEWRWGIRLLSLQVDAVTFGAATSSCGRHGGWTQAMQLAELGKRRAIAFTSSSWRTLENSMLGACQRVGRGKLN